MRLAFETKRDGSTSLTAICRKIYHEHPVSKPPIAAGAGAGAGAAVAAAAAAAAVAPNLPSAVPAVVKVAAAAAAASATLQPVAPRSGLVNFYRGFSPTLLGMLPYAGMSFLTHDTCGDLLRHPAVAQWTTLPPAAGAKPGKPPALRSWAELLAGGVAGLVSQTASYPLEVIRRRMQVGGAVGDGHRLRIAETARAHHEGARRPGLLRRPDHWLRQGGAHGGCELLHLRAHEAVAGHLDTVGIRFRGVQGVARGIEATLFGWMHGRVILHIIESQGPPTRDGWPNLLPFRSG